jgi:NAD(P) transhydrogenase subunit alpha
MLNAFIMLIVSIASFWVAYRLIRRIPGMLHTPLMSMTNAISAVVILGILVILSQPLTAWEQVLCGVAAVCASFNIAGGFAITDRMLQMFRHKPDAVTFLPEEES